jgi:AraC family transcriptional regulator
MTNILQTDRVVFSSSAVKVGMLRCPVQYPKFHNPGPTQNCVIVFPRTSVIVRRGDGVKFVADPGIVAFWNRDQQYWREELNPAGANADWFAIDPALVLDALRLIDPAVEDTPERPFRLSHSYSDPHLYLLQRQLLRRLLNSEAAEPLVIEETVLEILARAVRTAYRQWGREIVDVETYGSSLQEEIVWRAETFIANHFQEPLRVQEIAREVGASAFHLCRLFKRHRRTTLHARSNDLRLRAALDLLFDTRMDLTEVALGLGYSSQSHFTWAFRRRFGLTPAALRAGATVNPAK